MRVVVTGATGLIAARLPRLLDGDTASGRAYLQELARFRDGRSELNYAVYHDRYQRTPGGWKFTERVYEVRYLDTTPLAGSAPHAAGGARYPGDGGTSLGPAAAAAATAPRWPPSPPAPVTRGRPARRLSRQGSQSDEP
jgi:hypothetical protein